MHELQMKQADRQAKEYAAAKDRQTLEVLKRCIDYLARAGLSSHNPQSTRLWLKDEHAVLTAIGSVGCSEPPEGQSNFLGSWGRRCQGSRRAQGCIPAWPCTRYATGLLLAAECYS